MHKSNISKDVATFSSTLSKKINLIDQGKSTDQLVLGTKQEYKEYFKSCEDKKVANAILGKIT